MSTIHIPPKEGGKYVDVPVQIIQTQTNGGEESKTVVLFTINMSIDPWMYPRIHQHVNRSLAILKSLLT